MNMLTSATPPDQTMSSREIAELTGKQHDNVLKLVRSLIEAGIVKNTTPQQYVHPQNKQTYTEYLSDKRDSLVVVARLSPEFTAAVVDRWQELEAKQAPREPSKIELAQWFIESETKLAQANEQLAIAAPKAAALDRIADAAGLFGVREAAKVLGIKQNVLVSFLLDRKWAYRDERNTLQGYAPKLNAGYIEHIFSPPIMTSEGEKVFNTMRLTTKGVSRIGEILAQGVAA